MSRRKSRELAFVLLFEQTFTEDSIQQIVDTTLEGMREDGGEDVVLPVILDAAMSDDSFAMRLALGAEQRGAELDEKITQYSRNWSRDRLSRVTLSLLRLGIYEMLYVDETPVSIAINEAIELAKKYGGDEDAPYVNGVLGAIARAECPQDEGALT